MTEKVPGGKPRRCAAASALLKSRQAMTTCQSPLCASHLAADRPRPEDAPVTITVGFWVALSEVAMTAGLAASAVAAEARTESVARHARGSGQPAAWRLLRLGRATGAPRKAVQEAAACTLLVDALMEAIFLWQTRVWALWALRAA